MPLQADEAQEILAAVRDGDGVLSAYPHGREWWMSHCCELNQHFEDLYRTSITFNDTAFDDWQWPTPKVMIVADPHKIRSLQQTVEQKFDDRFHIVSSQEDRFEIQPEGSTKAEGLAIVAEHLGCKQSEVLAVGDADNDKEMLAWAGVSCVMGQGEESLKNMADHVLLPVDQHGLQGVPELVFG